RALLSIRLGRLKATRIATYVGQVLAVGLVAFGIWQFSIITSIIGVFVFVMAANEYKMVRFDGILSQHKVADVMRPQYTPLYADQPLSVAFEQMQHGAERHFLVFDEWHNLKGTLGERKLVKLAKDKKIDPETTPLSQVLRSFPDALLPADPLDEAYGKVYWKGRGILPVFNQGKLIGVVDENGLSGLLKVKR
ncbi:MAG: CBS domain-containing protein, partial [Phaeodactylibacter sp.]|nr:CBS domain-containing protein [Phaeodactylibacter sp.]